MVPLDVSKAFQRDGSHGDLDAILYQIIFLWVLRKPLRYETFFLILGSYPVIFDVASLV